MSEECGRGIERLETRRENLSGKSDRARAPSGDGSGTQKEHSKERRGPESVLSTERREPKKWQTWLLALHIEIN